MEQEPEVEVLHLGHLGLVVSIFKKYKIVEKIDKLLPKNSYNHHITHGEAVLAMVVQGLGFTNHRLYLSSHYFHHIALEGLFRPEVKAEHFTPNAFSRTLDAIYNYGATRFFTDTCLGIVVNNKFLSKFIFMDTTSINVTGKKYKGETGNLELKYGHSKDYRKDLKQLIYLLISTENGLPLHFEGHSGNKSDNSLFQNTITEVQNHITTQLNQKYWVLDASIYSKKFLKNKDISVLWITRVPESVKQCREAVEKEYPHEAYTYIDENYKYLELKADYGGQAQRWLLVRNRSAKYSEQETLERKINNEAENLAKCVKKVRKTIFETKKDAIEAFNNQVKNYPNFVLSDIIMAKKKKIKGTKRKVNVGYRLYITYKKNKDKIEKTRLRKGRFVLATNCFNKTRLTNEEMVTSYRSRNKGVEGCFKFIKDRQNNLSQIFLKKESRIEAMLMIMSLTLLTNNLAQLTLRSSLATYNKDISSQKGLKTKNPTFKWASVVMQFVTRVKVNVAGKVVTMIKGIEKDQETIIKAFGIKARQIYGLP